nr:AraC family transcriptional regulator [Brevundimonas sp. AAP58]
MPSDLANDADYAAFLMDVARIAPPEFGLVVGTRRHLSDLGVLGHVTMSCSTLREVFQLWKIYGESAGELIHIDAEFEDAGAGATWSLSLCPYPWLPRPVFELLASELSAAFFVFAREITGRIFQDFEVQLPSAPIGGVDYSTYFPGACSFNHRVARLVGPASAIDLPVLQHSVEPLELLVDQLGGDPRELQQIGQTTLRLYDYFLRLRGQTPTLAGAAAALRLSPRTLTRKLVGEQTTYGAALDDFRRRYALTLAQHGGLRAKQIAHLVGFQSENGLRKAFLQWTGMPIGAWSRQAFDPAAPLDKQQRRLSPARTR